MRQADQQSESGPGEAPKVALGRTPRPVPFPLEGQGPILQADPRKPALLGQGKGAQGSPDLPLRTGLSLIPPPDLSKPEPSLAEERGVLS